MNLNTFDIVVVDLESKSMVFRYEMFSPWESSIQGFLISRNEFIILGDEGISVLSLFQSSKKREIIDKNKDKWILNSIESCNYLKIDESNYIHIKE